jgi:hypothetical protein
MLSYQQRQSHWEWCRQFIDREAFYRAGECADGSIKPEILGVNHRKFYVWQFYLRRASYNAEFAHRVGLLFWDRFAADFHNQPFQLCGIEPSGVPVAAAIQNTATRLGLRVNVLMCRRAPKSFGIDNWFEGRPWPRTPVLLVDDIAASAPFLRLASARVQSKLNLPLHRNYFTLVNKVGRGVNKANQHTENYLDNELVALFTMNNVNKSPDDFREKYGRLPQWTGIVQ